MTTTAAYTAVRVEAENNAELWWEAVREAHPAFAASLGRNGVAVIDSRLWGPLAALPGFEGGPAHAPAALIDCGGEGDQWADAVAGRHATFDTLS